MTKPLVAGAIDIGTNSFRLLIAAAGPDGSLQPLAKELITVRMGQGLANGGLLTVEAMDRGFTALKRFADLLAGHQPERLRACATQALRVAGNRNDFLRQGEVILGLPIEVLAGDGEAALSLAGAQHMLGGTDNLVLADAGGGSSELAWRHHGTIQSVSVPLGAVTLTERHLPDAHAPSPQVLAALRAAITNGWRQALPVISTFPWPATLAASGGTATALAALDLGLTCYDATLVQGHRLSKWRLKSLIDRLANLDRWQRGKLPALDQGRGDIILAGGLILEQLLDLLGQDDFIVSDAGLLEGILLSVLH